MRIIIFASSNFSIPLLEEIYRSDHKICAVYTQPPSISGRGLKKKHNPISKKSSQLDIPIYYPIDINIEYEISKLKNLNPDIAIVSAYGQILSSKVLQIPKFGFLNLHPSLLPRWRGAAPIERALMSGDKKTGICTIKMVKELDAGPILAKEVIKINSNETNTSLSHKLSKIGAVQMLKVIDNLSSTIEIPQESKGIKYASKIKKIETRINWHQSGKIVDRFIRGLSEKPGAWTIMEGSRVKILKSKFVPLEGRVGHQIISSDYSSSLFIGCSIGAIEVEILQKEGKKPISAQEFIRGIKSRTIFFE